MRWSLIWLLLLFACTQKSQEPYTIIWENGRAMGVSFDRELGDDLVLLVKGSPFPVMGKFEPRLNRIVFTPEVHLERGLTYVLYTSKTKSTLSFTIPADSLNKDPTLLGHYPSCDTVPSNLLKIYLSFSEPMMEGRSSQYVLLFDNDGRPIRNAFLDLQPELWNEDGTVLTLWLDPGRIKQDLIPNKDLGTVLNDNHTYRLMIAEGWRSKQGLALKSTYEKTFTTTKRDVFRPNLNTWSVIANRDTIFINTHESLDWSLLNSAVTIWSGDKEIGAKTISEPCERHFVMIPDQKLSAGNYTVNIEARLEDLAGNNLNRLFETDVTGHQDDSQTKEVYTISFRVD